MENALLYTEIATLPDDLKQEVADFVAFLHQKLKKTKGSKKLKERPFGIGKGSFEMAPDFDEPLGKSLPFTILHVSNTDYKFNRDEANER